MDDVLDFAQAVVFLDHFKELPDHGQRGKVMCPLRAASQTKRSSNPV
jgi:hypothetical protein